MKRLNVLTTGVDFLTVDEAVQLGVFGNAPDIGCQQHMGDAEVRQAFPALLTDVAVDIGDLEGLFKEVGADVSLPLEIGSDLCHGCQGADLAAVFPVAPGGMVLAVGGYPDRKGQQEATDKQQVLRQESPEGFLSHLRRQFRDETDTVFCVEQRLLMTVCRCGNGQQEQQCQQPGKTDTAAGDDGVENAVE